MHDLDLQHLEDLAQQATSGSWCVFEGGKQIEIEADDQLVISETFDTSNDPERERALPNMHYIAAADPQTLLAMIAMIRELKEQRDAYASHLQAIKKARNGLMVRTLERGLAEAIDDAPIPDIAKVAR